MTSNISTQNNQNNSKLSWPIVISVGIAIFSMFFGAGNVVFPLLLGKESGTMITPTLIGLLITSIGGPLLGLYGAILFQGNCKEFFLRVGKYPGYLLVLMIVLMIGPFGAMPRCFVVSFGAITNYLPWLDLFWFNILFGALTFGMVIKRELVLDLLGNILSPLLLIALILIIICGIFSGQSLQPSDFSAQHAFTYGLNVGYDTMDLLASIFFAVAVWFLLQEKLNLTQEANVDNNASQNPNVAKKIAPTFMAASILGGVLLGIIYIGLSYCTALNVNAVGSVPNEQILSTLAVSVLGSKLGLVANIAVLLACLTTVMSLAISVADVLYLELDNSVVGKKYDIKYSWMIFVLVVLTIIFGSLGFSKIMAILHPIIVICYPAIIVLTVCNILYKTSGFKIVKAPFYLTLLGTIVYKYFL